MTFKYPIARFLSLTCLFTISQLPAADLSQLKLKDKVRLLSSSAGVCEGKVSGIDQQGITVRLIKGTPQCGLKDAELVIPAAQIAAIDRQRRSIFHRVAKKALLGYACGGLGIGAAYAVGYSTRSEVAGAAAAIGTCAAIFAAGYLPKESRTVALSCTDPKHCGQ